MDNRAILCKVRGISAAGSAFASHVKGRGFESHMLHFFFLQIWFIGRTLASQAGKAGSTPVICCIVIEAKDGVPHRGAPSFHDRRKTNEDIGNKRLDYFKYHHL